jgi:hypothetical protein
MTREMSSLDGKPPLHVPQNLCYAADLLRPLRRHSPRLLMVLLSIALVGCGQLAQTDGVVDITCAPKRLRNGEWATLTILQITEPGGENKVELKDDAFLNQGSFSRVSQSIGTIPRTHQSYRLQVYSLRPIEPGGTVVISTNEFQHLPKGFVMPSMVVEGGG